MVRGRTGGKGGASISGALSGKHTDGGWRRRVVVGSAIISRVYGTRTIVFETQGLLFSLLEYCSGPRDWLFIKPYPRSRSTRGMKSVMASPGYLSAVLIGVILGVFLPCCARTKRVPTVYPTSSVPGALPWSRRGGCLSLSLCGSCLSSLSRANLETGLVRSPPFPSSS